MPPSLADAAAACEAFPTERCLAGLARGLADRERRHGRPMSLRVQVSADGVARVTLEPGAISWPSTPDRAGCRSLSGPRALRPGAGPAPHPPRGPAAARGRSAAAHEHARLACHALVNERVLLAPLAWLLLAALAGSRLVADRPLADNHAYLLGLLVPGRGARGPGPGCGQRILASSGACAVRTRLCFCRSVEGFPSPDYLDGTFFPSPSSRTRASRTWPCCSAGLSPEELGRTASTWSRYRRARSFSTARYCRAPAFRRLARSSPGSPRPRSDRRRALLLPVPARGGIRRCSSSALASPYHPSRVSAACSGARAGRRTHPTRELRLLYVAAFLLVLTYASSMGGPAPARWAPTVEVICGVTAGPTRGPGRSPRPTRRLGPRAGRRALAVAPRGWSCARRSGCWPSRRVWAGRARSAMSSMFSESMPTKAAPARTSSSQASAVRNGLFLPYPSAPVLAAVGAHQYRGTAQHRPPRTAPGHRWPTARASKSRTGTWARRSSGKPARSVAPGDRARANPRKCRCCHTGERGDEELRLALVAFASGLVVDDHVGLGHRQPRTGDDARLDDVTDFDETWRHEGSSS